MLYPVLCRTCAVQQINPETGQPSCTKDVTGAPYRRECGQYQPGGTRERTEDIKHEHPD